MTTYTGTSGNDFYRGTSDSDTIYGLDGNDILNGADGADVIHGGNGNDTIYESDGPIPDNFSDSLNGEAGDDTIEVGYLDNADGGTGTDTLILYLQNAPGAFVFDFTSFWTGHSFSIDTHIIQNFEKIQYVVGTAFDDTINLATPTGQTAEVNGYEGADTLTGGPGTDYLDADIYLSYALNSDTAVDTLNGGGGNDTLSFAIGDHADGGTGSDAILFDMSAATSGVTIDFATLLSTGSDTIMGTTILNVEHIRGAYGTDFADHIDASLDTGGPGAILAGRGGDDWLRGEPGADNISGGDGNDTIIGTAGADLMDGGNGTDLIDYTASTAGVTVNLANHFGSGGYAQGDTLLNFENVHGSVFGDTITGDANANVLSGDAGNDVLAGGGGADTLDGGSGSNTADYSASPTAVSVDMLLGVNTGGDAAGDTLINIWNITGSAFADTLTGDFNNNFLNGNGGGDVLIGNGGDDQLASGPPTTGSGHNVLDGGDGDDLLFGNMGADDFIGGNGTDSVSYVGTLTGLTIDLRTGVATGGAAGDTFSSIENITGSSGDDTMTTADLDTNLHGGGGNDVLTGGAGTNLLDGGAGDDVLNGGDGNDTLMSGNTNGSIVFNGGNGFDTASFTHSGLQVMINLQTGVMGGAAAGDTFSSIESIVGMSSNDTITASNTGMTLFGAAGNDVLNGGAGSDVLDGGDGNDMLYGAGGTDNLTGDAGNDTFIFKAASGTVTVMDFEGAGATGGDVLEFASDTGYTTAAAVEAVTSYNFGTGVATITLSATTIITVDHVSAAFIASDFAFV